MMAFFGTQCRMSLRQERRMRKIQIQSLTVDFVRQILMLRLDLIRRRATSLPKARRTAEPLSPGQTFEVGKIRVGDGNDQQGQQETQCLPTDDGHRDGCALFGTRTDPDCYWDQTRDNRQ